MKPVSLDYSLRNTRTEGPKDVGRFPTLRIADTRTSDVPKAPDAPQEAHQTAPSEAPNGISGVVKKAPENPDLGTEAGEIQIAAPEAKPLPEPDSLFKMLMKEPLERVQEGLQKKEAALIEKKAKLIHIIDLILEKLPWLEVEGVEKLESLRSKPDGAALYKGFSEYGLSTYLVKAAGEDPQEQEKAVAFYQKIHGLTYEVMSLENNTIPTFRKAIEQLQSGIPYKKLISTAVPAPRETPITRIDRLEAPIGTIPPAADLAA